MQNQAIEFLQLLKQVPFVDVFNELTVNRPDRMIWPVRRENRLIIQACEMVVTDYTDDQLFEILTPLIHGNDDQLRALIAAIRLCIKKRHPKWVDRPSPSGVFCLNRSENPLNPIEQAVFDGSPASFGI